MAIIYKYPTFAAPSATWEPELCQQIDGSYQQDDDGVSSGLAAGGRMFSYQIADPTFFIGHALKLTHTELSDFRDFRDAVLGRTFQMTDDVITTETNVRIFEYTRRWQPIAEWAENGEQYWEGVIVLRKIIS